MTFLLYLLLIRILDVHFFLERGGHGRSDPRYQSINQLYQDDPYQGSIKAVDMTDPTIIWDHYVHGLDESFFDLEDEELFVDDIDEISKDLNRFGSTKYPCVICCGIGHPFNKFFCF